MTTPFAPDGRHSLPTPPTRLVGREHDCTSIIELLHRPEVCLVTLTGPGGVGKTHLSLEVAKSLASDFPDGVVFVPLATIRDRRLVFPTIAQALGIAEVPNRSWQEVLVESLRGRRLLILLDNLEQVMTVAADIAGLVAASPSVTLLITSRAPLRLRAEHEYPVAPLAVPEQGGALSLPALEGNAAVTLFVERAKAARPAFALTEDNAAAVVDICLQLDGLPLAIELAAAMTRVLSPQALLARMTNRLRLLTQGATDLPDRQRTLRDTIGWSHDLLDPAEQALFRHLAVFVNGATFDAIEHIAASDDVFNHVASLVDKSLVRMRTLPGHQEPRYRMLATIHEFASEQLEGSDERDDVRKRHLDWYLALAEQAEPELTGPAQAEWMTRLDTERDNLRAALANAFDRWPEQGIRLAGALWRYWATRGLLTEGHEWLSRYVSTINNAENDAQAKALSNLGNLLLDLGNYPDAFARYGQALHYWTETGNSRGMATALNGQGLVDWYRGDYAAARARHEQSLALRRELGDRHGEANSLTNLANAIKDAEHGDPIRARTLHQQALSIRRQLGDRGGVGYSSLNLGDVARRQGDTDEARALFTQSLEAFRDVGDTLGIGYALQALGLVASLTHDHNCANAYFTEAIAIRRELGDQRGIVETIEGIAAVAASAGHEVGAARLFGAASALREMIEAPIPDPDKVIYASVVDSVRSILGKSRFSTAWNEGWMLSVHEAADEATTLATSAPIPPAPPAPTIGLSEREIEVLRLIASGLTNGQAADRLYLSRRTVDAHLRRIYDKLDLPSRTDAIRFAHEHGIA